MALPHSKHPIDYPARFQFQPGAPCNGSSTCTDTCIQMIVEFYKEKTYSLSYIRKMAQAHSSFNERPCTGINYIEVLNGLRGLGVTHYKVAWNVNANFIAQKTKVGPVIVGVYYGNYPAWAGHCSTVNHAAHGGKTQCEFHGAHAILALMTQLYNGRTTVITRDPNHHSASRREAPKFDRITIPQLNATMLALPSHTAFSRTYAIYPTRRK